MTLFPRLDFDAAADRPHLHDAVIHLHLVHFEAASDRGRAADERVGGSAGIGDGQIATADAGALGGGARPRGGDFQRAGHDVVGLRRQRQKAQHGEGENNANHRMLLIAARLCEALRA